MVTGRLAAGIWTSRVVRGGFAETTFLAQGAKDFIGADVMQSEVVFALSAQAVGLVSHSLQPVECP